MKKNKLFFKRISQDISQIYALFCKDFILQLRQWKSNCFLLAAPVIVMILTLLLQIMVDNVFINVPEFKELETKGGIEVPYTPLNLFAARMMVEKMTEMNITIKIPDSILLYYNNKTVNSSFINSLMSSSNFLDFELVESPSECDNILFDLLEEVNLNDTYHFSHVGSIKVFSLNSTNVEYSIQPEMHVVGSQMEVKRKSDFCRMLDLTFFSDVCEFIIGGYMMNLINSEFVKVSTNNGMYINTYFSQVPFTVPAFKFTFDLISKASTMFYPMVIFIAIPSILYSLVLEKENKLKEMMKLLGLRERNYLIETFLFKLIWYILSIILFIVLGLILQHSLFTTTNWIVLLLIFIGTSLNVVSFSFLLASFINNSFLATVVGYIIALLFPLFGVLIVMYFLVDSFIFKWLLLFPPLAVSDVFYQASMICERGCFQLNNFYFARNYDFIIALAFLYFDSLLCFVLSIFFNRIIPRKWGVKKKTLIAKLFDYIWEKIRKKEEINFDNEDEDEDVKRIRERVKDGKTTEDENGGIVVQRLRKVFGRGKNRNVAVKDIFFTVNSNECFGPNGAGKTTTISILAGMYAQSNGTAFINGKDIKFKMDEIRESLGLCPQHSIFWKDLTPKEILLFFSRLKGVPLKEQKKHVHDIMERVGLILVDENKTRRLWKKILNVLTLGVFFTDERKAGQLSGGMKRRLAISISLCGNPKLILLDEPTTGLDPSNRRDIWDVILKEKKSRCVVLTTHSMEEADALSDRIGIMSHGRLLCCGSSIHLKKKFGNGYTLKLKFTDREKSIELVDNIVASSGKSEILKEFGNVITFQLNPDEKKEEKFYISNIFERMEEQKDEYGVIDFELSQTSLEDVFLNVIEIDENKIFEKRKKELKNKQKGTKKNNEVEEIELEECNQKKEKDKINEPKIIEKPTFTETFTSYFRDIFFQTIILVEKNTLIQIRGWLISLVQILFPFLIVIILVLISSFVDLTMNSSWFLHPRYQEINTKSFENCKSESGKCFIFSYTTNNNEFANEVMNDIIEENNLILNEHYNVFEYTSDLLLWLADNENTTQTAISFSNITKDFIGKNVTEYKIIFDGSSDVNNQVFQFKNFIDSTILYIYKKNYLKENDAIRNSFKISFQTFPLPKTDPQSGQALMFSQIGPLSFGLIPMILFIVAIYNIVVEKERRLKESLVMVGMRQMAYFLSWFISLIIITILTSIITVGSGCLFFLDAFLNCNQFIMFLLFFCFGFTLVCVSFTVTTFLNSAKTALVFGFIFLACVFIINFVVSNSALVFVVYGLEFPFNIITHIIQLFYSPINFSKVFIDIVGKTTKIYDNSLNKFVDNVGYGWSDLFVDNEYNSFGSVKKLQASYISFIYMFANSIIYFILYLYLDTLLNGENKTPFFMCFRSFWGCKKKIDEKHDTKDEKELKEMDDDVKSEYDLVRNKDFGAALRVCNLKKTYKSITGKRVEAVKGIDIFVPKGNVVGFLGHNGSGKSSTINSIAGIIKPTSGSIFVNDLNITDYRSYIQKTLGVCLQHDVLWNLLSAQEHIRLFARMKKFRWSVKQEVEKRLKEVSLYHVRRGLSKTFSGGMKRRLNVAMSFVENPKIILMDEPSSGLDPFSKREVWHLIKNKKENGTSILLTSHSMEEADYLSDKILIIQKGKTMCVGDSLFLKSKYSSGYVMKFVVLPEKENEFENLVKIHFPHSVLVAKNAGNYKYNVDPSYMKEMIKGLKEFENIQNSTKDNDKILKDYGISHSTLEDVYLKVTKEDLTGIKETSLEEVVIVDKNENLGIEKGEEKIKIGEEVEKEIVEKNEVEILKKEKDDKEEVKDVDEKKEEIKMEMKPEMVNDIAPSIQKEKKKKKKKKKRKKKKRKRKKQKQDSEFEEIVKEEKESEENEKAEEHVLMDEINKEKESLDQNVKTEELKMEEVVLNEIKKKESEDPNEIFEESTII